MSRVFCCKINQMTRSNNIAEKYELEQTPISINGKRLELYRVKNIDPIINDLANKGEEYISRFPFWVKVWESSIVLASHLINMDVEKGKEILEIGAGMGVAGLFLGLSGHKVTITDYDDNALELLGMNVKHNQLDNVSVRKLDWNLPDLTGKFDIICGSELVYNKKHIKPVIRLFQDYLKTDGTIFMSHDVTRMTMISFIETVSGQFKIENVVKRLKGNGDIYKIVIHSLSFNLK